MKGLTVAAAAAPGLATPVSTASFSLSGDGSRISVSDPSVMPTRTTTEVGAAAGSGWIQTRGPPVGARPLAPLADDGVDALLAASSGLKRRAALGTVRQFVRDATS